MQLQFDLRKNSSQEPTPRTGDRLPERKWQDAEVLSQGQLIEHIMEINPGASLEFLSEFSATELSQYLNHLLWLEQPRTGEAAWVRPGDSPAVLARTRTY